MDSLSLNYLTPADSELIARTVVKAPKSCPPILSSVSTGSKSLNAANTSSSYLPIKLSQPPNLHTFITSFLFNILVVLALYLLLILLGHQHHPL